MSFSVEGYHRSEGEGDAVWFADTLMTVKAGAPETNGGFTFLECLAPGGFAPPVHVHHAEDEAFYVLSGEMTVQCGERWWTAGAGSFVLLPRQIPHGFVITSPDACRLLQVTSPAGFERFIGEVGRPALRPNLPEPAEPDVAAMVAAAPRHGYEILGPPLRLPSDRTTS